MKTHREADPRQRLILALDLPDADAALRLADSLRPELAWVKVGLELFVAAGPDVVRKLVSMGLKVFLDLKLHDIPNTMAGGVRSLSGLGVRLATLHASAGGPAIAASAEAARQAPASLPGDARLALLAVTVLTSLDDEELSALAGSPQRAGDAVERYARRAVAHGADGLVASPREVARLREALGPKPLLVIPGIRPAGSDTGDQKRVATPAQALRDGADFLVVGRPIRAADDPAGALSRVLDEMAAAL